MLFGCQRVQPRTLDGCPCQGKICLTPDVGSSRFCHSQIPFSIVSFSAGRIPFKNYTEILPKSLTDERGRSVVKHGHCER